MSSHVSLAHASARPIPESVAALRAIPGAFPESFPDQLGEDMLHYAQKHNFEISEHKKEVAAYYHRPLDEFFFMISINALKRKARETGLWLPGTVSFTGEGWDLVAHATSWLRLSKDDQWLQGGGATASLFAHYDRIDDTSLPSPLWQVDARRLLGSIASGLSIYESLGDLMTPFVTRETILDYLYDDNVAAMLNGQISVGEYRKRQTTQLP